MSGTSLYVCDLDGTLLRSDGTLSAFSEDGLNRLLEAGVDLTLASGVVRPACARCSPACNFACR